MKFSVLASPTVALCGGGGQSQPVAKLLRDGWRLWGQMTSEEKTVSQGWEMFVFVEHADTCGPLHCLAEGECFHWVALYTLTRIRIIEFYPGAHGDGPFKTANVTGSSQPWLSYQTQPNGRL